ncbi:MAG: DMT family transporter [Actinomycetota bacterium]
MVKQAEPRSGGRPDSLTLIAFAVVVVLGGLNFVAVKLSNRGLEPFFGAGIRFLAASLLLFVYMVARRLPRPSRSEWIGISLYGILGFAAFYAFGYRALVRLPAAVGAVIASSVPLVTMVLARIHKLEPFTLRGALGAAMAIAGIGIMIGSPANLSLPIIPVLALFGAVLADSELNVVVKKFPTGHPVTANAFAMLIGATLLLVLSKIWGERWVVPSGADTWAALIYLVLGGSIALFVLYIWTIKRWTASGMSYMFVLMPLISVSVGAWLLDEKITLPVLIGGLVILAGVYLGALSGKQAAKQAPTAESFEKGCPQSI